MEKKQNILNWPEHKINYWSHASNFLTAESWNKNKKMTMIKSTTHIGKSIS